MRRFIAASALTAALLGAAACTSTGGDATTGSSSSPSAAPSPSVALVDRKTSCSSFKAAEAAAGLKMLSAMGEAVTAVQDPSKAEQTMKKVLDALKVAVTEYRTAAEKEAAQAADPELKAQFVIIAAELTKVEAEFAKITTVTSADDLPNLESAAGEAASAKIEEICK